MSIATSAGSTIAIGPVTTAPYLTPGGYAALPWVVIGSIQNLSEFGDQSNVISYDSMPQRRIRKVKGSDDSGQLIISCANDPLDRGQLAMIAARGSTKNFAFRVCVVDQADEDDPNSVFYFIGKVIAARFSVGDAQSVLMRTFSIELDSVVMEVPSISIGTGNQFDFSDNFNLLFGEFGGAI
jgi:hypothetical protein